MPLRQLEAIPWYVFIIYWLVSAVRLKQTIAKKDARLRVIGGGKIGSTADVSEQRLQGQVLIDLSRITQGCAALVVKELNAEARIDSSLIRIGDRTGDLVVTEPCK